jgi:hypothetical protein
VRPKVYGAIQLRLVAIYGTPARAVASSPTYLSVKHATVYARDRSGPDLIAMRRAFCYAIADAIQVLGPAGGPAYNAAVKFASGTYRAGECDRRPFATALWIGFTDGLWGFVSNKLLDKAADAAWGPVLNRVLSKLRLTSIGLGDTAKNLFNSWILRDVARILDASIQCFRTHKFPAWECSWVRPVNALERQLIK